VFVLPILIGLVVNVCYVLVTNKRTKVTFINTLYGAPVGNTVYKVLL